MVRESYEMVNDKVTHIAYSAAILTVGTTTIGVIMNGPLQWDGTTSFDLRPLFVLFCMILLCGLVHSYMSRWEIARPDQWQLLIRDGKLQSASVGGSAFRGIFDRIVRFPSAINKVNFRVDQVSKEMQGVVVSGFALWSIYKESEGPWKAYKNLLLADKDEDGYVDDKTSGNSYISDCAASIIRVTIANHPLSDILTKRDEIRSRVRTEMQKQVQGWGVWLETVEISDVQVSSRKLFEDLQCEFRNEQRLRAERIRLATERTLKEEQLAHDVEESRRVADAETRKAVARARATLEKEEKQAELLEATERVRLAKIENEEKIKRASLESERRIAEQQVTDEAAMEMIKMEAQLERNSKEDARIASLSDKGMALLQMKSIESVYRDTPVTIHSFLGKGGTGPASLLPGTEAMMTQAAGWEVLDSTKK
jgi:hypothetical protein